MWTEAESSRDKRLESLGCTAATPENKPDSILLLFNNSSRAESIRDSNITKMGGMPLLICLLLVYCSLGQDCPQGNNCRSCQVDSCAACSVDPALCESCLTKYYLDSNQGLICPDGCLTCNFNTECTECTPGYESEFNQAGENICVFYWWKWLLIIFGTIAGIALIGIAAHM